VIPIVLVLGGTLFASGLALYAIREREWTLAFFMGLIVLLALAEATRIMHERANGADCELWLGGRLIAFVGEADA
jgi:hypothetical protein